MNQTCERCGSELDTACVCTACGHANPPLPEEATSSKPSIEKYIEKNLIKGAGTLEEELSAGDVAATTLAFHLESMGASKAEISVSTINGNYMVTIEAVEKPRGD